MKPQLQMASLLAVLCLALSGCTSAILAQRIVRAPNAQGAPRMLRDPKTAELFRRTYSQQLRVGVGPPPAELSVGVLEPGNYALKYDLQVKGDPAGGGSASYSINWQFPNPGGPRVKPRATIVLLHGILVTKEYMIHWAIYLAQMGYRTVVVDLRGHGQSTGNRITYGAVERVDLRQVLDELKRRGLADGPIGVLGVSYGAAVGLDWAAIDPRVGAVVALEAFSDPRRAIIEFSRGYMPGQVKGVTDSQFASAERQASRIADFGWADADVLGAVRQLRVPVLFYHGAKDTWIPPDHSEKLFAAAPKGSRLGVLPDDNHVILSIRLDPIAQEVAAWFDTHLQASPAP